MRISNKPLLNLSKTFIIDIKMNTHRYFRQILHTSVVVIWIINEHLDYNRSVSTDIIPQQPTLQLQECFTFTIFFGFFRFHWVSTKRLVILIGWWKNSGHVVMWLKLICVQIPPDKKTYTKKVRVNKKIGSKKT